MHSTPNKKKNAVFSETTDVAFYDNAGRRLLLANLRKYHSIYTVLTH